jgi:endonuclease-3
MGMTKSERAQIVLKILNKTYPKTPIPLDHKDNFTLLVAVLLSAQCTDERVNQVTPKLFKIASNPQKMSKLSQNQIYKIIKPCGLGPKKSKAIKELSSILLKKFNGDVPNNFKDLEALPGVGHKTASVVMSQGFGVPAFAVDTHIHRLAQRWGLTNGKNVKKTEADLKKLFDKSLWNKLHLQIIFWGREFCQAKACYGLKCDVCKACYPKRIKPFTHKKP